MLLGLKSLRGKEGEKRKENAWMTPEAAMLNAIEE